MGYPQDGTLTTVFLAPYFWHSARKPQTGHPAVSHRIFVLPGWRGGHDANGILKGLKRGCNGIE